MAIPRVTGWSRAFDEPISLPKGKTLTTLRDAALYITELPKAEHDAIEWQAAWKRCYWWPNWAGQRCLRALV
jgi:hypothetical protein